ncbi:MAG: hypothetical protein ACYCV0_10030 [Desulfitobacteriaceae bacterium]
MMVVWINMGVFALTGFVLSMYFFFYCTRLNRLLRWLGGIVGGLITGSLMALISLLIVWP